MKLTVVLSAAVAVTLSAGLALAATPLGGDDSGFAPPDKVTSKCEDGVAKNVGTLVGALIKCNVKDSDDQLKNNGAGTFDGQACQNTATGKWDAKTGALTCTGAASCVDRNGVRDLTVTLVNLNGGVVFCDNTSGTPEDSPNTGFVPANKTLEKCEDGAAKLAGKQTTAVGKCHIKEADSLTKAKTFDEEGCETTADGKFDAGAAKLTGCPACLNAAGLSALRDLVDNLLDSNNITAYCGSPSGAFVQ
jgi:hypothetical protein